MSGIYNPSLNDFYQLSAADRAVLNEIVSKCRELLMPEPLEEFDTWLDRLAFNKQVVLLAPDERNARVLAAAHRSGLPVIQRTVDEPAPIAAQTVPEYLEQRGETREAAEMRIRERLGKPGQARTVEEGGRRTSSAT